jgi:hypothetical protein
MIKSFLIMLARAKNIEYNKSEQKMTKESEVEKTEKSKRYFLKGILICVIAIVVILGVYLGIGAYCTWHQEQFIQNIENSPTSTPTPNIATSTPTITSIPTLTTPTATPNIPVPTPTGETTEEVAVQGVTLSASSGVTVYAQTTDSVNVTINSITIKNTNGDVVLLLSPTAGSVILPSTGAVTTVTYTGALSGVSAGNSYLVTIVSSKGGSFVSSRVVAST